MLRGGVRPPALCAPRAKAPQGWRRSGERARAGPGGRPLTAAARQALFGAGGEAGNAYRVEVATIATRLATAFAALNVRPARGPVVGSMGVRGRGRG